MANLGPIHHVTHHVNPTPHAPPSSLIHPPSNGLLSSSTSFVQAHKKALLVGAGAVTLAAAGYYYYTTTNSVAGKKAGGGETDLESGKAGAGGASASSKRRKKKSAKKGVNDPDGPLLEEIKPKKEKTAAVAEDESKGEEEVKLEKKDGTSSLPFLLYSLPPSLHSLVLLPCSSLLASSLVVHRHP